MDAAERVFRESSGRVLAALIGELRDFELAEEAVQEAFLSALRRWPHDGVPDNPGGWIYRTARNKAMDLLRRRRTLDAKLPLLVRDDDDAPARDGGPIRDDRLRLIFTCCHPALAPESRVALTLRTLGGLQTQEIARAFIVSEATVAQRIVRAKRKIREAGIPYAVPRGHALAERLSSVLAVLYLVFNEGYAATSGDALVRRELCAEAIRLCTVLAALMPTEPEALGLLALMLLHDSRRAARTGPDGELRVLDEQDRSLWDRREAAQGTAWLQRALALARPGPYQVQAAIAALHAAAPRPQDTDWESIVSLYDDLLAFDPSPVVDLNRAVAVAMAAGPEAGLRLVDGLAADLHGYHLWHAARADLLRRMGRPADAAAAYERALASTDNDVERAYLRRRLREIRG